MMAPASPDQPPQDRLAIGDLREVWPVLSQGDRAQGFQLLDRGDADEFFQSLTPLGRAAIIRGVPEAERRLWMRQLAPDDATDLLQEVPAAERRALLGLIDEPTRREVTALLAYSEDDAAGLMTPRFGRLRPGMTVEEALRYLRRQARDRPEAIDCAYVLDDQQRLLGVVSLRELFAASDDQPVSGLARSRIVSVSEEMDQEDVARIIARHDLAAVPVIDAQGVMRGIVTVDDIVDVMQSEATEDIQKLGGMEAFDAPYLETGFASMLKKRAGWLAVLFLGELLTASAMAHYQVEIGRAVVLALFIPLIISSGGNSGAQAATLIIRAMALGEVRLRDWYRIIRRELLAGIALGLILAVIGLVRILAWQAMFHSYGQHAGRVAVTVALSLLGVVTWGTISGSMLPFIIRRIGFDPASASAPFVATLVDVVGLIIYFSTAHVVLGGALL